LAGLKVVQELSRSLQLRLERAMGGERGEEKAVPVYVVHPRDLDRASEFPVAALYLWDLSPEPAHRSRGAILETIEVTEGEGLLKEFARAAPSWVTCRYAVAIRCRRSFEEQEFLATLLRDLLDRPSVTVDSLPSLTVDGALEGTVDRFPITVHGRPELWQTLGLARHRLLVAFEVAVPLLSTRRRPVVRVFERRVDIALAGDALAPEPPDSGDEGAG
jgi:hypothetical protein